MDSTLAHRIEKRCYDKLLPLPRSQIFTLLYSCLSFLIIPVQPGLESSQGSQGLQKLIMDLLPVNLRMHVNMRRVERYVYFLLWQT